jgi:hypothetical protein
MLVEESPSDFLSSGKVHVPAQLQQGSRPPAKKFVLASTTLHTHCAPAIPLESLSHIGMLRRSRNPFTKLCGVYGEIFMSRTSGSAIIIQA